MQKYTVHTLSNPAALQDCPSFSVDHFQWTCLCHPKTIGKMGYLPDVGFLLQMECFETDPLRTYTAAQSPVCNDSAMEAFFAFAPTTPNAQSMYLNFEINANGAMHAKFGAGRKNRQYISTQAYENCHVTSTILADRWKISLCIPLSLIQEIYALDAFTAGDIFYCNFYKISESPAIEHYAAFHPIESDTPNFHVPACFAQALIV